MTQARPPRGDQRPSRIGPRQKRLLQLVVVLAVFMLADTLYLSTNRLADALDIQYFAVSDLSLPKFYQGMVLSHTGVGLVLMLLGLGFVGWHLPAVWRRSRVRAIYTGLITLLLGLILSVTGLFILSAANSRENAWAFWIHVGAALLLPVFYLIHRQVSLWKPSRLSRRLVPAATAATLAAAIAIHGLSYESDQYTVAAERAFASGTHRGPGAKDRVVADHSDADFIPANFVPPRSPFFPAATTTTTGDYLPSRIITRGDLPEAARLAADIERNGFVAEEMIGAETCDRCHPDIVEQWSRSAHRFASFNNPFYEATINHMRSTSMHGNEELEKHLDAFPELHGREGRVKSKWCSGCHDPALMLAGQMTETIDRTTAQAQAGLTCLACHAIDHIHDNTGNGNYNIADAQEDPYLFADAGTGLRGFLHDTALTARPTVHKRQMLKPVFRTSEYCATCHKVSLDTRVNGYRWLRGQNEYDNWHDSGVSLNASRTFYLPPAKRVCQDCHMPREPAPLGDVSARDGTVRSHRFLAVNTALPFLRGDQETIHRTEQFLQDGKLRVDIFALKRGERMTFAPERHPSRVVAGEALEFDVVVRNLGVGHTFPGGTNDSNEGWLEVSLLDGDGQRLSLSGGLRPDGHVDPAAHFYKALMVDARGEAIHRRNAQDIVAPVYVRVIGPGTADVAHFRVEIPAALAGSTATLRARLMWRKFDRAYTEFAYATNPEGFARFDRVPDLPITEIAAAELRLTVAATPALQDMSVVLPAADWERFNDHGIGLLLQGDTKGAARSFAQVAELAPKRLDGPRNLARVALRDGSLELAYEYLSRCEELDAGNAQTAWVWGVVLQEDGRYGDAASAYRRVLHDFPEDRLAWRNLGRVLYLDEQFDAALEALDRVLAIDPEDRVAHYHRMLALRGLGRKVEAGAAEAAYRTYQIDESAQELTRTYRLQHPDDNREVQPIHIHLLVAPTAENAGDNAAPEGVG